MNVRGLYEYGGTKFPDDADPYSFFVRFSRQAVTVPVTLLLQTNGGNRVFMGVGGYYSRILRSNAEDLTLSGKALDVNRNQYGLNFSVGFVLGPVLFSLDGRSQLNNVFSGNDFKAGYRTFSLTLGYNL